MGEMRVLDVTGDTKVIWDPDQRDEVDAAEEQFNSLTKKGYKAFEVGAKGRKTDHQVKKFDPELGKLILVPPIAGG